MTPLEKAAIIDKHASATRDVLAGFFFEVIDASGFSSSDPDVEVLPGAPSKLWDQVVQVARARHILGHYEYGDTNLFEWSDGKVQAAIIEELADAVVYQAWLLERAQAK